LSHDQFCQASLSLVQGTSFTVSSNQLTEQVHYKYEDLLSFVFCNLSTFLKLQWLDGAIIFPLEPTIGFFGFSISKQQ